MVPTQGPRALPPRRLGYEEKIDGWRILAYKAGATVRLISRIGVEHSKRFRAVAEAIGALQFPTLVFPTLVL
jgi:ATP-dependent DNA ligase